MLTAILATTRHGGLGYQGDIPWRKAGIAKEITQPDMNIFRKYTDGKLCLFGRKTYLGMRGNRLDATPLLPNRRTWVIGTTPIKELSSADTQFDSLDNLKAALATLPVEQEVVVCGGLALYDALLSQIDKIIWNCFAFDCPFDVQWPHHPTHLEQMGFVLTYRQIVSPVLGTAIFYREGTKAPW
jgi:dihydrofolate reductase